MNNIIQTFKTLPGEVVFEGIIFNPELALSGDEIYFCYKIGYVNEDSKHYNMYQEYDCWDNPLLFKNKLHRCSFLWLHEDIENDEELQAAIVRARHFLERHNLIS